MTRELSRPILLASTLSGALACGAAQAPQADPLPSWNDGAAKRAILDVVARTTREGDAECPGKPVGINRFIGRRPVLAFGNSDADHQMLQYTTAGDGVRFLGLVHDTDAERAYACDRQSHIGQLDKALDEARSRGWTVIDMKADWCTIVLPQR